MTRLRGTVAVMCMGRPRRVAALDDIIRAVLADRPATMSKRSMAHTLARRVVAELIADAARDDPLELSLVQARLMLGNDPALRLAMDPGLDLAGELQRERCERFMARGCRQLSAAEWQAETAAVADCMALRLAERFRRV